MRARGTIPRRPLPLTLLSLFFVFGCTMSFLAAVTLLFPGSFLEPIWTINPNGHRAFASLGVWAVVLLLALLLACAAASVGIWRLKPYGYVAAVVLLAGNLAGDLASAVLGIEPRAALGVPIVAAILCYLASRDVRRCFFGGPGAVDRRGGPLVVADQSTAAHYTWGGACDGWHLLKHPDLSVIRERVPAGAGEVSHVHGRARQFFFVLSGEATLESESGSVKFTAGQGVHVEPGVVHRFANHSGVDVEFLVISSPSTAGDRTDV